MREESRKIVWITDSRACWVFHWKIIGPTLKCNSSVRFSILNHAYESYEENNYLNLEFESFK